MTNAEINALIAEQFFGWTHCVLKDECGFECIVQEAYGIPPSKPTASGFQRRGFTLEAVPRYTADAAASEELEKRLIELKWWPSVSYSIGVDPERYHTPLYDYALRWCGTDPHQVGKHAVHEDVKMARALCALKSVGLSPQGLTDGETVRKC